MEMEGGKTHSKRRAGPKAKKKKDKKRGGGGDGKKERQRNPRAFAFKSASAAKRLQYKTMEREERRLHVPRRDAAATLAEEDLPPYVVVVQGPKQVCDHSHVVSVTIYTRALCVVYINLERIGSCRHALRINHVWWPDVVAAAAAAAAFDLPLRHRCRQMRSVLNQLPPLFPDHALPHPQSHALTPFVNAIYVRVRVYVHHSYRPARALSSCRSSNITHDKAYRTFVGP